MNAEIKVISAMVEELKKFESVEKAVLFGSRARGDNTELSDYDVAVFGNLDDKSKSNIRYVFGEELPTLHKIDLVFIEDIKNSEFRSSIEREGIVFYGKNRE